MKQNDFSRRDFLKLSGGLVVSVHLPINTAAARGSTNLDSETGLQPNAFIHITEDGEVHFVLPRTEMGQGVIMGLTTLIAEELEIEPSDINVILAPVDEAYAIPEIELQITGGSASMRLHYQQLREAAGVARELLIQAAVQKLSAAKSEIELRDGQVLWQGNAYSYGQFVNLAQTLDVPKDVTLKPANEFKQIGRSQPRIDALAKSTGQAEFGIDVDIPNLYQAALKRCDVIGGEVKSFDSKTAETMPGVKRVVSIFNGVAVVAQSYWQARKALDTVTVEWEYPPLAGSDSKQIEQQLKQALKDEKGNEADGTIEFDGDPLEGAAQLVDAEYYIPYLAHSTLEPMNCTAVIKDGLCEVWAPTQAPSLARQIASEYGDLSPKEITVHSTLMGGGFGRRVNQDYVAETVSIAKETGVAVQLIWSREDDTRNDFYRPASLVNMKAAVSNKGALQSWNVKRAGANITPYVIDEALGLMAPSFIPDGIVDWFSKRGYGLFEDWIVDEGSVEGLFGDYDTPHSEVRNVTVDPGLRVGFWRSVGHSGHGFIKESFADEIAHASDKTPLQWRLEHTQNKPRLRKVIEVVAEKAGWGKPSQPGRFFGLAAHSSFESYVAQIAEISVAGGKINVHKVTCVVDCGLVVNPDVVKGQMEGGIIFGITAALHGEITLKNGAVEQSNFHDYAMLRMPESPEIDVVIIDSNEPPTGVGEPAVPPIAGAIGNAVFAATGQRLRRLPLKLS